MNIFATWSEVFNASFQSLGYGLVQFAPKLIVALVLFVIGWVLGALLAKAFNQVFNSLKVDKLLSSIGVDGMLRKAGMNLNTGHFLGEVVKWFIVLVFLMPSLNLVGLNSIADFLQADVLGFLPRVVIAVFILIIATVVSEGIARAASASAKGMNVHSANLLGTIAKYAVWVFALIIALGQLGVAEYYMSILFTGIIFMLSLGGALAFGLGGREHAARFLSKISDEMNNRG